MASPGKVASHHAVDRYTRPSASIPPHVGVGGCTPSPRNDSADSMTMTRAMSSVATTSHGVSAFGRMWRTTRSEEHTSELQSHSDLVCRLLLEKKKTTKR